MKIKLLDFQTDKTSELVKKTLTAQKIVTEDPSQPQAVLLSSPTGSGKTVMLVAALEALLEGDDDRLGNPELTVLWLSDSPELNEQSRQKFLACSTVFTSGRLETIEATFDRQLLDAGKIYFINTQKLAVSGTLAKGGTDNRRFSIWQTISNTIEARGGNFVVIIDEAHKGLIAHGSPSERNELRTIPQKFLLGSVGQIPAVPLVIGISATPRRFNNLLDQSARAAHRVIVEPDLVRRSGLLKHRLMIHNPVARDRHADDTLLREAVRHHAKMKDLWETYCKQNREQLVRPLLVVQVEDGDTSRDLFSRTDIDKVVRSIRDELPGLDPSAICHCFQDDAPLRADGLRIRRVEPSRLQDEDGLFPAEVVLFKTALTTGWDCPRAETMMSFRTARDATMIEQLIGRMVRAPLAHSVEANDALNTVRLYLPGFDRPAVEAIIRKLSDPNSDEGVAADAEIADEFTIYQRAFNAKQIFERCSQLPSWSVPRRNQQQPLIRLLKLANRLTVSTEVDAEVSEKVMAEVVERLYDEVERRADDALFQASVLATSEVRLEGHLYDLFSNRYNFYEKTNITASDESVDEVFRACSRSLSGDEAVGLHFWRQRKGVSSSRAAKLEFIVVSSDQSVKSALAQWASRRFDEIYSSNLREIHSLPYGKRLEIEKLAGGQERPIPAIFKFKDSIEVKKGPVDVRDHIYVDDKGDFAPMPHLNNWERKILEKEEEKPSFLGWFRNPATGDERLCIPYKDYTGTWKSKSPDFLVFHQAEDDEVRCSIIEPHDLSDHGSYLIAKGMAEFAEANSTVFDRIELTAEVGQEVKRLNFAMPGVRREVAALHSNDALLTLLRRA